MINIASPASNSVYGRDKLFWYDKRADKPGSAPGVFLFGLFFKNCFSFWPFFLYSYCWPCWSCTWINIYFKLKSGVLFWKRDFKSSWSAYWPSLRPEKTIRCQDMSLLWNSWIFSVLVDIMINHTQYTTNCANLHPTSTTDPTAKVKPVPLYIVFGSVAPKK